MMGPAWVWQGGGEMQRHQHAGTVAARCGKARSSRGRQDLAALLSSSSPVIVVFFL